MSQSAPRALISFDWAMKSILRDKANFDVLEGFLSTLLQRDIHVLSLLESEGNQQHEQDKYNRVDLMVQDANDEIFLIEIQHDLEIHYLKRLLYGTSKLISENLKLGESFARVRKAISISILYFQLDDKLADYIYHGYTQFYGWHTQEPLQIQPELAPARPANGRAKRYMEGDAPKIFPEYYLIDVVSFQNIIQSEIDEWIYFFKNSEIRDDFRAKNIQAAREKLDLLQMDEGERRAYERYLINRAVENDVLLAAHLRGLDEGREEGVREGEKAGIRKEKLATAKAMVAKGFDHALIAEVTGLPIPEIEALVS